MAQLGQTVSLYQNLTAQNTNIQPVAFSSSYSDLINTPVISAVGHTGQYSDVLNAPTRASQFANDANYAVKGEPVSEFANDAQYTINGSNVGQFTNDKNYAVIGSKVSQFANDANYTPTGSKVSQFQNDAQYTPVASNVSQFTNDKSYTVAGSKVSQFQNDATYTVNGSKVSQFQNDASYTVNGSKVSQFANDSNYAVSGTRVSQFSNDVPYATVAQVQSSGSATTTQYTCTNIAGNAMTLGATRAVTKTFVITIYFNPTATIGAGNSYSVTVNFPSAFSAIPAITGGTDGYYTAKPQQNTLTTSGCTVAIQNPTSFTGYPMSYAFIVAQGY